MSVLRWAAFFAVVSIVAGVLGVPHVASFAAGIARVLVGTIMVPTIVGTMLALAAVSAGARVRDT